MKLILAAIVGALVTIAGWFGFKRRSSFSDGVVKLAKKDAERARKEAERRNLDIQEAAQEAIEKYDADVKERVDADDGDIIDTFRRFGAGD